MVVEEPQTETTTGRQSTPHPLDPLSRGEIERAGTLCREHHRSEKLRFVSIALKEPDKADVYTFTPGDEIARRAFAVMLDRADGSVYEAVVDLTGGRIESWEHRPDVQPIPLFEEFEHADAIIREDPDWLAAMQRRGITDISKIKIDPWPAGNFGDPDEEGHRLLRGVSYVSDEPSSHAYARPVEGLVAVVDLNAGRVLRVVDEGDAPVPEADIPYYAEEQPALREDVKPLEITQPEGVGFVLDGHELRWQKWRMRVSLHPREGLVLHQVGYEDHGELRPIMYRASLSEMVVPYGDTSAGQYFKNAFDSGEVGLGRLTNSLQAGCDCLGEITYLDGMISTETGGSRLLSNAICIHEEDFNLLWKHTDHHNDGHAEVRRNRRLVVSSWASVGNYDYGFYWYFYQDGSIEHEIKLTGIIQTKGVSDDEPSITAHRVAKNLAGPIHQHFFSVRLDLDIDGTNNSVYEVDSEPLPADQNPYNNAFRAVHTLIGSESESARKVDSHAARHWRVVNPDRLNALGEPVAYGIFPGETCAMMAGEDSSVGKRATFARNQLWVTQFAQDELYAAGDYPAQSKGGDGLPAFTAQNRALEGRDVVLWYTVGVNHIVRPEDFPVSSVHHAGFTMRPWGFFDTNPALDVPPPEAHSCDCAPGECTC